MNEIHLYFVFLGEKGEPGANCDVIEKIKILDRENKLLSQQVSTLEHTVDVIEARLNKTIESYTIL